MDLFGQADRLDDLSSPCDYFRLDVIFELVEGVPFWAHWLALHEIELIGVGELSWDILDKVLRKLRINIVDTFLLRD